ncbi:MAG: hypothetical protein Q8L47_00470 [bacterium]|nr:hypothetical protein [bacterium]
MGYRDNNRSGGFGRDRPSSSFGRGRSSGGFGGRREGGFGGRRDRPEMHDVICDKCGKECQVPFKPTGDRPVLCSECFGGSDSGNRRSSDSPRNFDSSSSSGISKEQFNEINTKLDKILGILEMIEFEDESEEESDEEDSKDSEEEKA